MRLVTIIILKEDQWNEQINRSKPICQLFFFFFHQQILCFSKGKMDTVKTKWLLAKTCPHMCVISMKCRWCDVLRCDYGWWSSEPMVSSRCYDVSTVSWGISSLTDNVKFINCCYIGWWVAYLQKALIKR